MSVRAKFYVSAKSQAKYGSAGEIQTTIKLAPVTSGSKENEEFYKWTPSGNLDLGTVNPKVVEQFDIGDEFYIDFTKAE